MMRGALPYGRGNAHSISLKQPAAFIPLPWHPETAAEPAAGPLAISLGSKGASERPCCRGPGEAPRAKAAAAFSSATAAVGVDGPGSWN